MREDAELMVQEIGRMLADQRDTALQDGQRDLRASVVAALADTGVEVGNQAARERLALAVVEALEGAMKRAS